MSHNGKMDDQNEAQTEPRSVGDDVLTVPECWALLRTQEFGRLAVVTSHGPDIFPINVVVDQGTLLFRTAEGSKLRDIEDDERVAFEVDGFDATTNSAWSVVMRGSAKRIREMHAATAALESGVSPWQEGPKGWVVRITPIQVTGRRFERVDRDEWTLTRPSPIE